MSIFKGTINPEIAAQLKAREKVVSQINDDNQVGLKPRDENFLQYTTSKNSWVRMVSFVNASVGCSKEIDKTTGKPILDKNGKPKEKCLYEGDDLSKKYVLEGGTQYYNSNSNSFNLREGVGKDSSIYASNIDNGALRSDYRQFGYRPMPGITSIDVINKGAYGSLRQATVKFFCWDKHQLDELEILFMRVGYTVLLEWGWSQYLDHDKHGQNGINTYPNKIKIANFTKSKIDPFSSLTEDEIYNKIDSGISAYNGNYDAMLGYIQNFSWQMLSNGGFECTTVLISRGEAISSIKVSNNPYTIVDNNNKNDIALENTINSEGNAVEKPTLSLFEKLFLNIKAHDNQTEIYDKKGEFYVKFDTNVPEDEALRKNNTDLIKEQVENTFNNIKEQVRNTTLKQVINSNGDIKDVILEDFHSASWLKPADALNDGTAIEYIVLDQVIAILNSHFLLKDTNNKPIVSIVMPFETPCLASEDSVSVDPTTCLIRNDFATFISDNSEGFNPYFYTIDTSVGNAQWTSKTTISPEYSFTYKKSDVVLGRIGNIYISIQKLIDIYRSKAGSSSGVSVLEFLEDLLENISHSLGGINDFKLYTQRNTIQIIDAKYLEVSTDPDGSSSSKFKFDLVGLKSICRDVKINSRIFSEQASMIAIGAAASGEGQNIGDIYSSTQQEFNKGIKDRVIKNINFTNLQTNSATFSDGSTIPSELKYYYDLYSNIATISGYIKRKVLGTPMIISGGASAGGNTTWDVIRVPADNEITNASTLLKTFLMQFNGKDIDFKAIIPFELEITLDGIGGFIIGQIFTIDKSILPSQYAKSNIGFIVTGVSHSLQRNDWVTVLKTQICLLDNDKISKKLSLDNKLKLKSAIASLRKEIRKNSYIGNAMADYMIYLTINILSNGNKYNREFIKGTESLPKTFSNRPGGFFSGNDSSDNAISWDDYLQDIDGQKDTGGKNSGIKQAVEIIIGKSIPFFDINNPTGGYLYKWWSEAKKTPNQPDFPYNSFSDLTSYTLADGVTRKLDTRLNEFQKYEVLNRRSLGSGDTLAFSVSANDVFIYRYFNNTPISSLHSKFVKNISYPETETYRKSEDNRFLKLNDLRLFYLIQIKDYIAKNWSAESGQVDVNGSGHSKSLESNQIYTLPWYTPQKRFKLVK
jgi:hypothetical protein